MFPVLLSLSGCTLFTDLGLALGGSPADAGLDPDPACEDYLACIGETEPGALGSLVETYGGDGSCWHDETTAATCAGACESELERLLEAYPEEPACGGTAPPEVDWPFQPGAWDADVTEAEGTCGGTDEETMALLDALFAEYGVRMEREDRDYPSFTFTALLSSLDCTLDGRRYTCRGDGLSGMTDEEAQIDMTGTFDEPTHSTSRWTAETADCTSTLTLELTAD